MAFTSGKTVETPDLYAKTSCENYLMEHKNRETEECWISNLKLGGKWIAANIYAGHTTPFSSPLPAKISFTGTEWFDFSLQVQKVIYYPTTYLPAIKQTGSMLHSPAFNIRFLNRISTFDIYYL